MHSRALFFAQFGVVSLVGVMHVLALNYSLYWHYIWLDLPVHFLGGMWAALFFAWLCSYWPLREADGFATTMLFVLAIGLGWEVFELFVGVPREANFAFDTGLDLLMDLCGGLAGYAISRWVR
jgi:hypothetical protein